MEAHNAFSMEGALYLLLIQGCYAKHRGDGDHHRQRHWEKLMISRRQSKTVTWNERWLSGMNSRSRHILTTKNIIK